MGDPRGPGHEHAHGRLRARGAAGLGGHDDARPLPVARVVLYSARDCSLCERARATLAAIQDDVEFELEEVDITGDPELEARYRELLPVVEIDGEQAFTYYVHIDSFIRRVTQSSK